MECLKKTWPQCSLCGNRVSSGIIIGEASDGKFFCPQCAAKPKCFCCDLPGNCSKLDDGRDICAKCAETAVMDMEHAFVVINDVRKTMRDHFNLYTKHDIKFKLVDIDKLGELTSEHTGMELGLYHYQETIEETLLKGTSIWGKVISKTKGEKKEESHMIYLLYGMSEQKLIEVIAHELGHDWMQEFYPNIKDLKIKEGWAEYAAFLVNESYDQEYMNNRINDNPDPVYGDGFRMIRDIVNKEGMNGLESLFDKENKKQ